MNKHDTDKIISALQSFADRLKNNPVAGTTYEGDWDTLIEAQVYLKQQQSEIEVLKKKKEHWENQYIIENKKWKSAEKSFLDLLVRTANDTHPAELTDEEIFSIAIDCTYGGDLHADKFAKAILRKAQEK